MTISMGTTAVLLRLMTKPSSKMRDIDQPNIRPINQANPTLARIWNRVRIIATRQPSANRLGEISIPRKNNNRVTPREPRWLIVSALATRLSP